MLRVAKLRIGGEAYYLDVSAARPDGPALEPPGEWFGSGLASAGLGPDAIPGPDTLGGLLAGSDASGRVLGSGREQVRVAGFDLTFAAPKSVSLLWALGGAEIGEEVLASHRSAVGEALGYAERRVLAARRTDQGERRVIGVEGALGAAFVHRTSRALDPHLHTHAVLANLARGQDGSWSALDGRGLYAHARAMESLYHVQLRHELACRLGVRFGELDRGRADIEGIGLEVRAEFSSRSRQIAAHLAERSLHGPRAAEIASHATRDPRDPGATVEKLLPIWQDRARALGLSGRRIDALTGRVPGRVMAALADPEALHEALRSSALPVLSRVVDQGRPLARRHIVPEWAAQLPQGSPARAVEQAADLVLADLGDLAGRHPEGIGREAPGVAEWRYLPAELAGFESAEREPALDRGSRGASREPDQGGRLTRYVGRAELDELAARAAHERDHHRQRGRANAEIERVR